MTDFKVIYRVSLSFLKFLSFIFPESAQRDYFCQYTKTAGYEKMDYACFLFFMSFRTFSTGDFI
jgi:hypothetical protein